MLYVSILIELLRSRPAAAVWLAALAQALLWTLVPTLFYSGPPGDVPFVLAIGHEFQLGIYLGPPLAFWMAELAFDAGRSQPVRGLRAFAGLRGRDVLGGLPLGRAIVGRATCGAGSAAHGGHRRLDRADPRFRPRHSRDGAMGDDLAALLASCCGKASARIGSRLRSKRGFC